LSGDTKLSDIEKMVKDVYPNNASLPPVPPVNDILNDFLPVHFHEAPLPKLDSEPRVRSPLPRILQDPGGINLENINRHRLRSQNKNHVTFNLPDLLKIQQILRGEEHH
jgi:hypothetical protein